MMGICRAMLVALTVLTLSSVTSACGVWRGDKDVDTDVGEGAIGEGPGLITGKRGAIVIYQK